MSCIKYTSTKVGYTDKYIIFPLPGDYDTDEQAAVKTHTGGFYWLSNTMAADENNDNVTHNDGTYVTNENSACALIMDTGYIIAETDEEKANLKYSLTTKKL